VLILKASRKKLNMHSKKTSFIQQIMAVRDNMAGETARPTPKRGLYPNGKCGKA
jgi:hypothetical protein